MAYQIQFLSVVEFRQKREGRKAGEDSNKEIMDMFIKGDEWPKANMSLCKYFINKRINAHT